jgi:hypothetical protein
MIEKPFSPKLMDYLIQVVTKITLKKKKIIITFLR